MCGISGFCLKPDCVMDVDTFGLSRDLFTAIEPRGGDAAGLAWYEKEDDKVWTQKTPGKSTGIEVFGFKNNAPTVIHHTRKATQGSPQENKNNHPMIAYTDSGMAVVGVHNGVIWNDRELTRNKELVRGAETDSDVIFQMLAKKDPTIPAALEMIEGSMAIAYLVQGTDDLFLAKGDSSPLLAYQTPVGVVFCSVAVGGIIARYFEMDVKDIEATVFQTGDFAVVHEGQLATKREFKTYHSTASRGSYYTSATARALGTRTTSDGYGWDDNEWEGRWGTYQSKTSEERDGNYSWGKPYVESIYLMEDGKRKYKRYCTVCTAFLPGHDELCPHAYKPQGNKKVMWNGGKLLGVPGCCPWCGGELDVTSGSSYVWCVKPSHECPWFAELDPTGFLNEEQLKESESQRKAEEDRKKKLRDELLTTGQYTRGGTSNNVLPFQKASPNSVAGTVEGVQKGNELTVVNKRIIINATVRPVTNIHEAKCCCGTMLVTRSGIESGKCTVCRGNENYPYCKACGGLMAQREGLLCSDCKVEG